MYTYIHLISYKQAKACFETMRPCTAYINTYTETITYLPTYIHKYIHTYTSWHGIQEGQSMFPSYILLRWPPLLVHSIYIHIQTYIHTHIHIYIHTYTGRPKHVSKLHFTAMAATLIPII